MKVEALGLIEIKGFLGAVAAADAALKTSDVDLLNAEKIRGGQTTIQLAGDVAAVKVAVESATVVAENLNCLISSHVIPRMADDTAQMILGNMPKKEERENIEESSKINEKAENLKENVIKEETKAVKNETKKETKAVKNETKIDKKVSESKKAKPSKKNSKTNKK